MSNLICQNTEGDLITLQYQILYILIIDLGYAAHNITLYRLYQLWCFWDEMKTNTHYTIFGKHLPKCD